MEKVLAVYDPDILYTTRFMEYLDRKEDFEFEIAVFTERESLTGYLTDHQVEILLVGSGLYEEEIPKDHIKYIFCFTEYPNKSTDTEYPAIFKYQSMQAIISDILASYASRDQEDKTYLYNVRTKLVTIAAPIISAGKLAFAWTLAYVLSEKVKTLFIPLEQFPVLEPSAGSGSVQALSDFIYYLKEDNPNIILKMKSLIRYMDRLPYLAGVTHGFDLLTLNREDIIEWTKEIEAHTDYEIVIFYLSIYTEGVSQLIEQSDTVILPVSGDTYEASVIKEWERQITMTRNRAKDSKLQRIAIPETDWIMDHCLPPVGCKSSPYLDIAVQCTTTL